LRNKKRAGVENDERNLGVEAEFARDEKRGRKNSPNLRWKFTGTQVTNFGEGWRELRVAARDGVF
jgi:hypothetical protein